MRPLSASGRTSLYLAASRFLICIIGVASGALMPGCKPKGAGSSVSAIYGDGDGAFGIIPGRLAVKGPLRGHIAGEWVWQNGLRLGYFPVLCKGPGSLVAMNKLEALSLGDPNAVQRVGRSLVDKNGQPLSLGAACEIQGDYVLSAAALARILNGPPRDANDGAAKQPIVLGMRGRITGNPVTTTAFRYLMLEGLGATVANPLQLVDYLDLVFNPCSKQASPVAGFNRNRLYACINGNYKIAGDIGTLVRSVTQTITAATQPLVQAIQSMNGVQAIRAAGYVEGWSLATDEDKLHAVAEANIAHAGNSSEAALLTELQQKGAAIQAIFKRHIGAGARFLMLGEVERLPVSVFTANDPIGVVGVPAISVGGNRLGLTDEPDGFALAPGTNRPATRAPQWGQKQTPSTKEWADKGWQVQVDRATGAQLYTAPGRRNAIYSPGRSDGTSGWSQQNPETGLYEPTTRTDVLGRTNYVGKNVYNPNTTEWEANDKYPGGWAPIEDKQWGGSLYQKRDQANVLHWQDPKTGSWQQTTDGGKTWQKASTLAYNETSGMFEARKPPNPPAAAVGAAATAAANKNGWTNAQSDAMRQAETLRANAQAYGGEARANALAQAEKLEASAGVRWTDSGYQKASSPSVNTSATNAFSQTQTNAINQASQIRANAQSYGGADRIKAMAEAERLEAQAGVRYTDGGYEKLASGSAGGASGSNGWTASQESAMRQSETLRQNASSYSPEERAKALAEAQRLESAAGISWTDGGYKRTDANGFTTDQKSAIDQASTLRANAQGYSAEGRKSALEQAERLEAAAGVTWTEGGYQKGTAGQSSTQTEIPGERGMIPLPGGGFFNEATGEMLDAKKQPVPEQAGGGAGNPPNPTEVAPPPRLAKTQSDKPTEPPDPWANAEFNSFYPGADSSGSASSQPAPYNGPTTDPSDPDAGIVNPPPPAPTTDYNDPDAGLEGVNGG